MTSREFDRILERLLSGRSEVKKKSLALSAWRHITNEDLCVYHDNASSLAQATRRRIEKHFLLCGLCRERRDSLSEVLQSAQVPLSEEEEEQFEKVFMPVWKKFEQERLKESGPTASV